MYKRQNFMLVFILAFIIFFINGCGKYTAAVGTQNKPKTLTKKTKETKLKTNSPKPIKKPEDKIYNILDRMSLEEKIGQLFIIAFRKDEFGNNILKINKNISDIISKYNPGGVILFSENIDTIFQTSNLISSLQKASEIPLFIAVDEEGGIVSRLNYSGKMHATKFPNNMVIGDTGNPDFAYKVGKAIGEEIASLGFNMDFAPVADVNTNPKNPVIGKRSYGSDPYKVAKMVSACVRGLHDAGILSVIKHFPGHGDTSADTHTGEVIISHDLNRLKKVEFIPFKAGILAGADGVMTAHIRTSQITENDLPATLSHKFLTDILRRELGFKKLIITDALEMGAITHYYKDDEAAVLAFLAGADILLLPGSLGKAWNGILSSVKAGRISLKRLNDSVLRILKLKEEYGILNNERKYENPEKVLGSTEHLEIVNNIYENLKK